MNVVDEKLFKHFLEMSQVARSKVINKMGSNDRCRFTRCSKLCDKEAKASKNFVEELNVNFSSKDCIKISVISGNNDGFTLSFIEKKYGRAFKKYKSLKNGKTWEDELDPTTSNLFEYAFEELQEIIIMYQNSIKVVRLSGFSRSLKRNLDFGIDRLRQLEDLYLRGDFDVSKILDRLRRPLKNLTIIGNKKNAVDSNCEEIFRVRESITWPQGNLSIQQLFQISAKNLNMHIGTLTEADIFEFIQAWQNGTLGKEIEIYRWSLEMTTFSKQKLFDLLGIDDYKYEHLNIIHYIEAGKTAKLSIDQPSLTFSVNPVDGISPEEKCETAKCSKKFENNIDELKLSCTGDNIIVIKVTHRRTGEKRGFYLKFFEKNGKNVKRYFDLKSHLTSETQLESSDDIFHRAMEDFRLRIKKYQYSIKSLRIRATSLKFNRKILKDYDFEVDSFNHLDKLEICGDVDVRQFLVNLQRPLRKLTIKGVKKMRGLAKCEQIYQVQRYLNWPQGSLNLDQLLRLSTKNLDISLGSLTEDDIFEFIQSWQDGELGRDIQVYRWHLKKYKLFGKQKLCNLLGVNPFSVEQEIKHSIEEGKTAKLSIEFSTVTFDARKMKDRVNKKRDSAHAGLGAQ